ncbi:hypothetical protein HYFRA_00006815 [Hymenoscyphus fraxineus]|uniref:Uncharacterized protein n=1 Tax=Hymenoscyphus fraxineus TaxID=746836 RepID=A0A9N9KRN4_9HELO|nr:hypothetical protein HYFRA_00006815 [Hymenoscyphus fraxineus]
MALPLLKSEDWSLIIWANSPYEPPHEFRKVMSAISQSFRKVTKPSQIKKLLTNYGAKAILESSKTSKPGARGQTRREILRLAGAAANILRNKTFLQVIFPSEISMRLAFDRLTRSRLPYRCDEHRELAPVDAPPLPPQDLRGYLMYNHHEVVFWPEQRSRIVDFIDGVDKAGAVGLYCDRIVDESTGRRRRNGTGGSVSSEGGSENSFQLIPPAIDPDTPAPLKILMINDQNARKMSSPNDFYPYGSEDPELIAVQKQYYRQGVIDTDDFHGMKEEPRHLSEDQILEWYKGRELEHRTFFPARTSEPPDARQTIDY